MDNGNGDNCDYLNFAYNKDAIKALNGGKFNLKLKKKK